MVNGLNPDKAKLAVKRGRKAAGLLKKMAELPRDRPSGGSVLLLIGIAKGLNNCHL
jgi:hypothetical protein